MSGAFLYDKGKTTKEWTKREYEAKIIEITLKLGEIRGTAY